MMHTRMNLRVQYIMEKVTVETRNRRLQDDKINKNQGRGKKENKLFLSYEICVEQKAREIKEIEFYQRIFTQIVCDMSTKL